MNIDRRRRSRALVAVAVGLSLIAAACGDDDGDEPASSASGGEGQSTTSTGRDVSTTIDGSQPGQTTVDTEPSDLDPEGIIKYGQNLISGVGVHFDPIQMRAETPHILWSDLIYGTLMRQADGGAYVPWMAEDVEIVDPQTVTITLRPGVTFTDGAAYDAEAVKAGLLRTRDESAEPAIANGLHGGLKAVDTIDIVDPLNLEVHLNKPIASMFIEAIASLPGLIVSPKQVAEAPGDVDVKPVGAGPYVLEQFAPEQVISLRRNPAFWDADSWRLAGVDFVHTPLGAPRVNGLLADTIDFTIDVPIESLPAVEADKDLSTEVTTIRYNTLLMCAGKPPLDNKSIRKAIQIGIDREEYLELIYDGLGEPAYGFYGEDHPSYDPEAKEIAGFDPEAAKKLVAESGITNPTFDVVIVPTNNMGRNAEVIQAQLKRIGITMNILSLDNVYADWIEPQKPGALFAPLAGYPVGGYVVFSNQFVKGGVQAYCGIEDPAVMNLVNQAVQLAPDDPKAIDLYRQANLGFLESAYHIPLVFQPMAVTWNSDRIGGTPSFQDNSGQPRLRFDSIYVKQ